MSVYEQLMSPAEYLRVEEPNEIRHEYVAGRMFAMGESSKNHNRIVVNLIVRLSEVVRNTGCDVFATEIKTRIESLQLFYYPDLVVTNEPDDSEQFITSPRLVVEVLSPSTKSIDQREKLLAYRTIPSVLEYMIVHQDCMKVELHRKDANEDWERFEFAGDCSMTLISIPGGPVELKLAEIFDRVDFKTK